jgi:UDP-N-acetylglucosamine 2-epimerase (non-hydrolysing)
MKKIKVMLIFGTRPEAVKMAPLALELKSCNKFDVSVCVTAQHRQMLDQVLSIFNLKPDFDLNIMKPSQTLTHITTGVLEGMETVLAEHKPDIVLVHGDTTTTFAAALSAFYAKIPVGHVEAGLRTYDIYSPFPEEMNRRITSEIASVHFAPTQQNRKNLALENVSKNVFVTGNTVIDALKSTVKADYEYKSETLKKLKGFDGRLILMTAHRRENLGKPLENICNAVKKIALEYPDVKIVYPVHLNPVVQNTAHSILGSLKNVSLCEPLGVDDMHNIMNRAALVMTDSGGLQEEAPALGKPVLVLRTETERPEAVCAGTVKMAGVEEEVIYKMAKELLDSDDAYKKMSHAVNPYGDGNACKRISQALLYYFGEGEMPKDFIAK